MESVVAKRWEKASMIVAGIALVLMVIAAITPGTVQTYGGSDVPNVDSPARNIAIAQHTDVDLGEKVKQMYLISVVGILVMALVSFLVLVIMSLRNKKKDKT